MSSKVLKRFSIVVAIAMIAGCSAKEPAAPAVGKGESGISGNYLMGTGSATGNYYAFGSVLTQVINTHTGANITVNSTGGSVENVRLLSSGDVEFALIQTDVNDYALNGTELFAGKPQAGFLAVTACYPEMVQIVASKASGIKSVADMKGKKICVGAAGSGYEVAARQILKAFGLGYDDIDERFLSQSEAKNALQDGAVDAFFMCSGYPNSNVTELSLTGKIDVVSIEEPYLGSILKEYPFYAAYTTPDDQYNLGHPVTSVSVMSMLVASDKLSEGAIYAVTKAIYENLPEIVQLNSRGKHLSLEGAFRGIPGKVHPGAAKYFKEKGIQVP